MTGAGLRVNTGDPVPPYEQVRRQLADQIGAGLLLPGTRLPPVRQLASDLGLAAGTVARAYRELEAAGLIESRRGGGTRVGGKPDLIPAAERELRIRAEATAYVRQARLLGADDEAITRAVTAALAGD